MDCRLLHPWDSPGKSTGVGCHFLLQGIFLTQRSNPGLLHCRQTLYHLSHQGSLKWKWKLLSRVSLRPHGLYSPWNSPGQNTGVGSLSLPQGIFPNLGSNPGLPHCRWLVDQLSHKGSPRILPFSSRSSWPKNWTRVSGTAGRFLPTELSGKSIRALSKKEGATLMTNHPPEAPPPKTIRLGVEISTYEFGDMEQGDKTFGSKD